MDCKILMIGDWVVLKSNGVQPDTKIRITELSTDGGFVDDCDNFIGYEELDPIKLTEDILVKNGWQKESITIDGDYANWYGEIPICQEENEFNYERIELTYVHQLQHLLRLCGIEKEIEL